MVLSIKTENLGGLGFQKGVRLRLKLQKLQELPWQDCTQHICTLV